MKNTRLDFDAYSTVAQDEWRKSAAKLAVDLHKAIDDDVTSGRIKEVQVPHVREHYRRFGNEPRTAENKMGGWAAFAFALLGFSAGSWISLLGVPESATKDWAERGVWVALVLGLITGALAVQHAWSVHQGEKSR